MRFISCIFLAFLSAWSVIHCIHATPTAAESTDFTRYDGIILYTPPAGRKNIQLIDNDYKVWIWNGKWREKVVGRPFRVGDKVTFLKKTSKAGEMAYDVRKLLNVGQVFAWQPTLVFLKDLETSDLVQCEDAISVNAMGIQLGTKVIFKRRGTASGEDTAYDVVKAVQ